MQIKTKEYRAVFSFELNGLYEGWGRKNSMRYHRENNLPAYIFIFNNNPAHTVSLAVENVDQD